MQKSTRLSEKISEVIAEMKARKLWTLQPPVWVHDFSASAPENAPDFTAWLQFVYLPNLREQSYLPAMVHAYIAPQAAKCLNGITDNGRLIRLLVELDSLQ